MFLNRKHEKFEPLKSEVFVQNKFLLNINFFIGIILAFLLFLMLNYLSFRHYSFYDTTSLKVNSISNTSHKFLSSLPENLKISVILRHEDLLFEYVSDLLENFRRINKKISINYYNPDRDPEKTRLMVKRYDIKYPSVIVFEYLNKIKFVTKTQMAEFEYNYINNRPSQTLKAFKGEQVFINAIKNLIESRQRTVYFTTGHGEPSILSNSKSSIEKFVKYLKQENYRIESIETIGAKRIPGDCEVLIIFSPYFNFLDTEVELIVNYLDRGGKILFLLDPVFNKNFDSFKKLNLKQILNKYFLELGFDVVIDRSKVPIFDKTFAAQYLYIINYGDHNIVRSLKDTNIPTILSMSRSVVPFSNTENKIYEVEPIFFTSENGWAERSIFEIKESENITYTSGIDLKGPVSLAASSINKENNSKLIVFGSSSFLKNYNIENSCHIEIALNSLLWLLNEKISISGEGQKIEAAKLNIDPDTMKNIVYLFLFVAPLLCLTVGGIVYYARRK